LNRNQQSEALLLPLLVHQAPRFQDLPFVGEKWGQYRILQYVEDAPRPFVDAHGLADQTNPVTVIGIFSLVDRTQRLDWLPAAPVPAIDGKPAGFLEQKIG
jgi:hypothetical protein